ncbi:unannotated protein [freshwater metagenome]|uniref:Unannotated protein n=1 Tax=freshwater metagenome TaxID=449393 RepID=A0A6J6PUR6_9ZZZZ
MPRRLRRRASRSSPAPALCEEQGGYPRRQPDRRHAHLEGSEPASRAPGSARVEPCGFRGRRLRGDRPQCDAGREPARIASGLFCERLRVHLRRATAEDAGGTRNPAKLRRGDDLHAGRYRLLVDAADQPGAASDPARKAALADGQRRHWLRYPARRHREPRSFHGAYRRRHHCRQLHADRHDRRADQDSDHERAVRAQGRLHRRRRSRCGARARGRGERRPLNGARGRRTARLRACRPRAQRREVPCDHRLDPPDDEQERDRGRRLSPAQDRHAR